MSSIPLGSPHEPIPPCRSPRPPSSSSSTTSLHLLPPQHPTPVLPCPLLRLNNRSSNRLDATSYRQSQRLCWLKPALLLRKENRRRGHRRTVGFVFLWQEEGSQRPAESSKDGRGVRSSASGRLPSLSISYVPLTLRCLSPSSCRTALINRPYMRSRAIRITLRLPNSAIPATPLFPMALRLQPLQTRCRLVRSRPQGERPSSLCLNESGRR
jgi:hypothetical protein